MESTRKPGGLEKFQVTSREECGLIIRNEDDMIYVVKIPNRAKSPDDYQIRIGDVQKVQEVLSDGEEVVGFLHTHLEHHDLEPSDTDFAGAEINPDMENLVYKPSTGEFVWYGAITEVTP